MSISATASDLPKLFEPCTASPNCVSSTATDSTHYIDPLVFTGPPAQAWARLKDTLLSLPRTRITTEHNHRLQAEVRSLVFRFVDDMEFVLLAEERQIHVRSASRIGHSDFGVNRRRVERIRKACLKNTDSN